MPERSQYESAASRNIVFKRPGDKWPEVHEKRFGDIRVLGDKKFRTWSENNNTRLDQEPWVRDTTARAKYVVDRACDLAMRVCPNESGWRMQLEHDVLRRFSVEVACPNCRARLWRSEIEATYDKADKWSQELDDRRKRRKTCQCPAQSRPQDFYERGTSLLFDDRVEEPVVLGAKHHGLPKKIPDRVFGLRLKGQLENLVTTLTNKTKNFGQPFECTPFRLATNPPVFPFLVLEAKADSSKNGFHDIETQTALPIRTFLELQTRLKSETETTADDALVWFIGYRGSAWKVYGCYVDTVKGTTRYNIHPLWNGDLTTNDAALQLILIIDYIIDWARDIYRPTILRELKVLTTGRSWDDVSVGCDSEIRSQYNRVRDWISGAARTNDEEGESEQESAAEYAQQLVDDNPTLLNHRNLFSMELPKTKLGTIQSASSTHYYFDGLCITEENVDSLLILSRDSTRSFIRSPEDARYIIEKFQSLAELIVTSQHVLDEIEYMWTGRRRPFNSRFQSASETEVYAVLEYRCFLDKYWNITRQLTCLSVSKSALSLLMKIAFKKRSERKPLSNISRGCPSTAIYDAIECLLSDSPMQTLQSAIAGTLLSIRSGSLDEKDGPPTNIPIQVLNFYQFSNSWIRHTVMKYSRLAKKRPPKEIPPNGLMHQLKQGSKRQKWRGKTEVWLSEYRCKTADRSFERKSSRISHNVKTDHDPSSCRRCQQYNETHLKGGSEQSGLALPWEPINQHPSACNSILVQGLHDDTAMSLKEKRYNFCLFIIGDGPSLSDDVACLADVIRLHLETDKIYNTILQTPESPQPDEGGTVLYNLWWRYGYHDKRDGKYDDDLEDWLMELEDKCRGPWNGAVIPTVD
ncbi:hypothetical protein GGS24DRAFT_504099 [Hypoxylon argillaceum]|nr:hypothetical protein GGS24DRAFT_504099 [Hypoxylon argillaceum]